MNICSFNVESYFLSSCLKFQIPKISSKIFYLSKNLTLRENELLYKSFSVKYANCVGEIHNRYTKEKLCGLVRRVIKKSFVSAK